MKVSDFIRQYQITGELPDDRGDSMLSFLTGWLIGHARSSGTVNDFDGARKMAIKVAEFIEARARD